MEPWLQFLLTIIGALGGGYLGVKIALARLETQMAFVLIEIDGLREDTSDHAAEIADHRVRLEYLDRR
jgi:uncharacterized protein YcfJ